MDMTYEFKVYIKIYVPSKLTISFHNSNMSKFTENNVHLFSFKLENSIVPVISMEENTMMLRSDN